MNNDFILRVLRVFENADSYDSVFWRTDGEHAPITFFALCNDVFWWATADAEKITEENVGLLESTARELIEIDSKERASHACHPCTNLDAHSHPTIYLESLFAARCRKMRPQRPFMKNMKDPILSLFLACGPERTRDDE